MNIRSSLRKFFYVAVGLFALFLLLSVLLDHSLSSFKSIIGGFSLAAQAAFTVPGFATILATVLFFIVSDFLLKKISSSIAQHGHRGLKALLFLVLEIFAIIIISYGIIFAYLVLFSDPRAQGFDGLVVGFGVLIFSVPISGIWALMQLSNL